jgi:hypothetical protein
MGRDERREKLNRVHDDTGLNFQRKVPPNLQKPSTKLQTNPKYRYQIAKRERRDASISFEAWDLELLWSLGFGFWNF